jgi:hypothetical protein
MRRLAITLFVRHCLDELGWPAIDVMAATREAFNGLTSPESGMVECMFL